MAEKPAPLPADLPENWTAGQIVAPTGEEVGLSHQHGYNYLMEMVNKAQRGVNTLNEWAGGILNSNILTDLSSKLPAELSASGSIRPGVTGVLPVENGGTGVASMEELQAMFGSGELGKYILTGSYSGHIDANGTAKIYFKPDTETGGQAEYDAVLSKYGAIVLCSIYLVGGEDGADVSIGLGQSGTSDYNLLNSISTSSGTISKKYIFVSVEPQLGYYTLSKDDALQKEGHWLEIREAKGPGVDYRVEMLFLMPDVDHMGAGSGGGSSSGTHGTPGPGVPAGGSAGQVLTKKSAADYDTEWAAPPEASSTGVTMEQVDTAINEAVSGLKTPTAAQVGAIPNMPVAAISVLTEAEYTALSSKNAATLYLIKE